jgi:hypothetical protein
MECVLLTFVFKFNVTSVYCFNVGLYILLLFKLIPLHKCVPSCHDTLTIYCHDQDTSFTQIAHLPTQLMLNNVNLYNCISLTVFPFYVLSRSSIEYPANVTTDRQIDSVTKQDDISRVSYSVAAVNSHPALSTCIRHITSHILID